MHHRDWGEICRRFTATTPSRIRPLLVKAALHKKGLQMQKKGKKYRDI